MTKIGIAIVKHQGCYLVGLRPQGVPLAGHHEFPGGKQIIPESTQETAERECREETGLLVEASEMLHQQSYEYDHGEVQLDFWLCQPAESYGNQLPELPAPWKWIARDDLSLLNFPPANAQVLRLLQISPQSLRSFY